MEPRSLPGGRPLERPLPGIHENGAPRGVPASGYRNNGSGGLNNVGSNGYWWSYAPNSQANARNLNFNSGNVNPLNNNNRANGFSVRPSPAQEKARSSNITQSPVRVLHVF